MYLQAHILALLWPGIKLMDFSLIQYRVCLQHASPMKICSLPKYVTYQTCQQLFWHRHPLQILLYLCNSISFADYLPVHAWRVRFSSIFLSISIHAVKSPAAKPFSWFRSNPISAIFTLLKVVLPMDSPTILGIYRDYFLFGWSKSKLNTPDKRYIICLGNLLLSGYLRRWHMIKYMMTFHLPIKSNPYELAPAAAPSLWLAPG